MAKYLLSVHTSDGDAREPMSEEEQARSWQEMQALEADLQSSGAWVFSGRLAEPGDATVVDAGGGDVIMTDGPFAESKEHMAGFYIIEAEDLDAALAWASRVTACVRAPIEVWPFTATA